MRPMFFTICLSAACLSGCSVATAATFTVAESALAKPLVLIAYGDMRFTDPTNTTATNPRVRRALVSKIAEERPAAVFINGDITYHGIAADYDVFRQESEPWRARQLRVYPALGNHEFSGCFESACLENWWTAFPVLRGRRWYSVPAILGTRRIDRHASSAGRRHSDRPARRS